jgi:Cu/Ag efflux protein CusF
MRRLILAVVLTSGAGWALAQDPQAQPPAQPPQPQQQAAPAAKDTKEMTAVVVATDSKVKTITVKQDSESGAAGTQPEATLSVDEKALTKLKSIKVGEKVKIVLKTDAMGKESVTSIEKAKSATPEK